MFDSRATVVLLSRHGCMEDCKDAKFMNREEKMLHAA